MIPFDLQRSKMGDLRKQLLDDNEFSEDTDLFDDDEYEDDDDYDDDDEDDDNEEVAYKYANDDLNFFSMIVRQVAKKTEAVSALYLYVSFALRRSFPVLSYLQWRLEHRSNGT